MSDLTEAQMDEYRAAANVANPEEPTHDHKGRIVARRMTEREIMEESLILLRAFGDALEALGSNPMLRAIPGVGKMLGK